MAFSFIVEMLNLTMISRAKKRKAHVVELNAPMLKEEGENNSDEAK